jgi:hypothetical protein
VAHDIGSVFVDRLVAQSQGRRAFRELCAPRPDLTSWRAEWRRRLVLRRNADLAVGGEADEVEDFLADIDADRSRGRNGGIHELLLRLMRSSLGWRRGGQPPLHSTSGRPPLWL